MERGEPLRSQDESRRQEPLRGHYSQEARGTLMAQAALVELQIKEGQTLIERLAHEGIAVTVAGWVRESESGDWYLYLATPLVSESGSTRPAYGRVNAVIRTMEEEGFRMDPFDKKVIGPRDPIA